MPVKAGFMNFGLISTLNKTSHGNVKVMSVSSGTIRTTLELRRMVPNVTWEQIYFDSFPHGRSYHLRFNVFAYRFEPKIWDYSIPVLEVS